MFASLSRALLRIPTPAKAERDGQEMFINLSANLQSQAPGDRSVALYSDQNFKDTFFKLLSAACVTCFKEPNKNKQLINLRYLTFECFEKSQSAQHYLSKADDERQILAERFFSPATKIDLDSQCFLDNQLYQSAALVFRGLDVLPGNVPG